MSSDHRTFLRRFETLATRYARTLNLCEDIIHRHGIARNIRDGLNGTHSFHDYMFLCFTKGTKSLGSIYITVTAFRGEDALILVRSVYEAYVQMAFLLRNPLSINDLVTNRVRLMRGELDGIPEERYPNKKAGRSQGNGPLVKYVLLEPGARELTLAYNRNHLGVTGRKIWSSSVTERLEIKPGRHKVRFSVQGNFVTLWLEDESGEALTAKRRSVISDVTSQSPAILPIILPR